MVFSNHGKAIAESFDGSGPAKGSFIARVTRAPHPLDEQAQSAADAGNEKGGPLRDEIAENVGALMTSFELYDVIYTDGIAFSVSPG